MPRALRALLTLVVAGALGIAGAGAANASATGASTIAPFTYTDASGAAKSVPRGCVLIHSIVGDGLDIGAQTANVDCAGLAAMRGGLFCDVEVRFTFTPTGGRTMSSEDALSGCRTLGIRLTNPDAPQTFTTGGKACAQLYVEGALRTTSCHTVRTVGG